MAAVNISLANAPRDVGATTRRFFPAYTGPASYATGGDTGLAAALGIGKIFAVLGLTISNGTLTYIGWYSTTTGNLLWFDMAGAQVANATDLSTFVGQFEVIGQ